MKVIILAAGEGRRLKPLTDIVPKPLLPVAGRAVLDTLLSSCRDCGIASATIVVGHLEDRIRAFCGTGERFGLTVDYVRQREQKGTGDAIRLGLGSHRESFMVMSADNVFTAAHVGNVMSLFEESGADCALSLKALTPAEISSKSSVRLGEDGRIEAFVEKPAPGEALSNIGASLLQVFGASAHRYIEDLSVSPRGELELTEVIVRMIEDGLNVRGAVMPTPADLTTPRDFLSLNFDYLDTLLSKPGSDC